VPSENEPEPIEDLDCSFADFEETQSYSSVGKLAKKQQTYTKFFELTEGGMRLPTVKGAIHSNPRLDAFVAAEFDRFSRP